MDIVLSGILQDFYANVRTSSEDYYSKSSLVAIRQGIRRYQNNNLKSVYYLLIF